MKYILALRIINTIIFSCNGVKDNKENNTNLLTTVSEGKHLVTANDCKTYHHKKTI
jgi:hypothetical protein